MAQKLNVPLPSKGLVVDRPAEYIDSRSASAVENMEYNRGIIHKRVGTTTLGATLSERVQRFFELQVGSSTRLFRIGLTKVEVLNKSTNAWGSVAHAVLTGAAADVVSYAFPLLSAEKTAVFTNGKDAIRKCSISGNDAVLGGSPPLAKYVAAFGDYLLLGNITDGGNARYARVQWCDTGDIETWTGGNAGSVDLIEDPEDITGFGLFGNLLTVHKTNSIYVGQLVSTSDVIRFDRKTTGVGTCAEATIANLPSGEQIFLALDGIHLFNGVTAPPIDSPIQDEIREEMNLAYAYKAQGVFVKELDEYWVAVPIGSDTEPLTIYKYNYRTKQVFKDTKSDLVSLGIFLNTVESTWDDKTNTWDSETTSWNSSSNMASNPVVILGGSTGVTSERGTGTNDNGAAVSSKSDTKDFTAEDLGAPDMDRLVRWKGMKVWAKGTGVTVSYSTNGGATWTAATTLTLDSDYPTDSAPLMVYFDVVSSKLRLRFSNAVLSGSATLKKYQLLGSLREVVK